MVIFNGGGGNGEKLPDSGGREAFVGGLGRRGDICVSGSAVVGREAQLQRRPRQRSGATHSYSLLCPSRPGGRHTLSVAEAEAKRKDGVNSEEVKWIEDKG